MIRTKTTKQRKFDDSHPEVTRLQRKIDQHDEMASLALSDGDVEDAGRHLIKAQKLRNLVKEKS